MTIASLVGNMNAAIIHPPFTDTITWRVVVERSGVPRLHSMRLRADMPIKTVMEEILALYHREQPWWSCWFSQHVVEKASIVCTSPRGLQLLGRTYLSVHPGMTNSHIANRLQYRHRKPFRKRTGSQNHRAPPIKLNLSHS